MRLASKGNTVLLPVHVQPRASRTELAGMHGDVVRIRIAAPPVDGEANDELERFLARLLNVARSRVSVVSGSSSRKKTVAIEGVTATQVETALR